MSKKEEETEEVIEKKEIVKAIFGSVCLILTLIIIGMMEADLLGY